jgi:hypothetical protein
MTLTDEELLALATKEMDNFIDMGCFRYPDQVRAPLIEGFTLGYKYARRALLSRDQAPEVCEWGIDDDGNYSTSCGETWVIDSADVPISTFYNYCPHCGKRIKETTK